MHSTSYIELSKSALKKNINYLKKRIGKKSEFCSVIKGNAYGHGIREFIPLAERCGVRKFAVSDAFEADHALEVMSPESHLIIMAMIDNCDLEWAVENNISFFVFELDRLVHAIKAARKVRKKARIHIELETGLNRTGFDNGELKRVIDIVNNDREHLSIEGLCTHYAGAESIANYARVSQQIKNYQETCTMLAAEGIIPVAKHTACSAAALTYENTIMDMVRFGIAQYGFWPSTETRMYNLLSDDTRFTVDPLHRVLSWKSRVMSLKLVPPGKFVSYGTSYLTTKNEILAVVPVGYSHGYSRSLSNLGHVLIHGRKAPVVGFVNMNMLLVSVNYIPHVKKGDEVVLIGKQEKQTITVASFAEMSKYVNYEMLTRLPAEIPRVVVR